MTLSMIVLSGCILVSRGVDMLVCLSPFEGEMQCMELEAKGLAQYIYSPDGDVFPLGGKNIMTELQNDGKCCTYGQEEVLSRESMSNGQWSDYIPELLV
jgi:5'-3' exonuclease